MSRRCTGLKRDGTFSLARYSVNRAWTISASRLPSCVNSVGRPSLWACQPYASASRPTASSGSTVEIQGMGVVDSTSVVDRDDAGVHGDGRRALEKGHRIIVGVEYQYLGFHLL